MEAIKENEFIQATLENAAWREISEGGQLTVGILEAYQDKLDWEEISKNSNIVWTAEGVKKFIKKLNWYEFSWYCPDSLLSESMLREFKNHWNWSRLSNRETIYKNWDLLETFADYIDWGEIINYYYQEQPEMFLNKFYKYIPMAKFFESRLWRRLVEVRADKLMKEICLANKM